jgi:isocitrate dehydrogenase kinase/phosphatase
MTEQSPGEIAAQSTLAGFDEFNRVFRSLTSRAERRFEAKEWVEARRDASDRLDLYEHVLKALSTQLRTELGPPANELATWAEARPRFASLVADRYDILQLGDARDASHNRHQSRG